MVKFVTVENDVQLEVLDWGGSGSPLVLLAGLGDTAHVFDDFAQTLTARHRVLAITRRAHGRSSTPPTGYGFPRLAEDVVRVIEAMGVSRPIVIGHSFAGEEMHALGARDSEKIAGMVYLDAAFNRGDNSDSEAYRAVARSLPSAPGPSPTDLASFAALRAFPIRIQGAVGPEAHLRTRFTANPDGSVGRPWAPDLPARQAISSEMAALTKAYNPARAPGHGVAHQAVHPQRRQREGERGKRRQHERAYLCPQPRHRQMLRHRRRLHHPQVGIDLPSRGAERRDRGSI